MAVFSDRKVDRFLVGGQICGIINNSYQINYVHSGTSLIRSPTGLGKSDLDGEVTVLQEAKLHCGIQYGTEQG